MPHKEEPAEKREVSDLWTRCDWQVPHNNVPRGWNGVARHDQALLEQDRNGGADWVTECSSNTSSLSYLEDCFKYLPLNVNPITGSLCLFRQKQLCTRPVSLIIINPLGGRACTRYRSQLAIHQRRMEARARTRTPECLRQNSWGIGTVTEWESVKTFLFQHQNLPWKHLDS